MKKRNRLSNDFLLGRFEQEFIEERRRQLEIWLNRICQHPVLCASFPVRHFITCELTEKNNKVKSFVNIQNPLFSRRIGKPENAKSKKMNYVNHLGFIVLHLENQNYLKSRCNNL